MECFRIDESGYTGFDLLNSDQRFQGASAVAISDEEAARLIKEYFPKLQAPELKYRALSRRQSNHERLISLQRDVLQNYKSVTYVCDKRFLLMLMFIDFAVEPFYYKQGVNLYKNGENYAMASLLTCAGPALLGQPAFDNLLIAFQRAVKEKTQTALDSLIASARATQWRQFPEVLGPLAELEDPACLDAISTPGVETDAAIVVLMALINRMESMTNKAYRVEHDQSKNLQRYNELLRRFIEHDQEIKFRQSQVASVNFPLKLSQVIQVESTASPAVQLADVLIGAAIEAANNLTGLRSGGLDPSELLSLYTDEQFIHLVPSTNFEEQQRFREGSQAAEMIDYFAGNFFDPLKSE